MPARIPATKEKMIKVLLGTKMSINSIAKRENVARTVVQRINSQGRIRPKGELPVRLSPREKRFIERALGIAKFTSMRQIAIRAGKVEAIRAGKVEAIRAGKVDPHTVSRINIEKKIRDKDAINAGMRKIPFTKFMAVVDLLVNHPELSFRGIGRQTGVSFGGVHYINERLGIQDKLTIAERDRELRKRKTKERHYRFSPKQKWEIIVGLKGFIKYIVIERAKAEDKPVPVADLIQEAILESFHGLDTLSPKGDPKKYIGGITRNVVRQHLRGTRRRKKRERRASE